MPTPISRAKPDISRCIWPGKSVSAIVSLIVDTDGEPRQVKIAQSSTIVCFDNAAIHTVEQYKFRPATRNGKPVAARINVGVNATR